MLPSVALFKFVEYSLFIFVREGFKKKKEILAEVSGVGVREGLRGQIFFIRSVF